MNLLEVKQYLEGEGFIVEEKGEYRFTRAFYAQLGVDAKQSITAEVMGPGWDRKLLTPDEVYKRFLQDSGVPRMRKAGDGKTYVTGGFTKTGSRQLQLYLNKGYQYKLLCDAVKLYYEQVSFCQKLETLLKEGTIITYYEEVKAKGYQPKKTSKNHLLNKHLG